MTGGPVGSEGVVEIEERSLVGAASAAAPLSG